jgi:DNA-damage-inducible protein J
MKNANISIRLNSQLKEQTENVLEQFGLNMTVVVTMLFHQIVRENAIPLSLTLNPKNSVMEELNDAKNKRQAGYKGRTAADIADDMERIVANIEHGRTEV